MQKIRLLVIDDDEISRELLQLMLEDQFSLTLLDNPEEARSRLFSEDFDIILLDVSSPKINGKNLCKSLGGDSFDETPIVIGMGQDLTDDAIREVFEAGAYDFFVKPYNVVLFHESMQRLASHIRGLRTLSESDKRVKSTLITAISEASFYGSALSLMTDISRATSIRSLSNAVLYSLSQLGVHCAIQLTTESGEVFTFEEDSDVVGERTIQVFNIIRNQGDAFRFGRRLVFNAENVSLLVKSTDEKSEQLYNCIADICAKLVPAIQRQLDYIGEHAVIIEMQRDMQDIIQKLHAALTEQVGNNHRLVDNITGQINLSIDRLELTEQQELYFLNLVESELTIESSEGKIQELENLATKIYTKVAKVEDKITT
jgi:CheY-like chemotaxis protein